MSTTGSMIVEPGGNVTSPAVEFTAAITGERLIETAQTKARFNETTMLTYGGVSTIGWGSVSEVSSMKWVKIARS